MSESRRLSAIMFTDIVGYSAVMNENEAAAINILENQKKVTKPIIDNYNGKILKPQGDGFMVEFSSVVDAVRCAMRIQKEISSYNSEKNKAENINLRIGIHMGDLLIKDNDTYGNDVNIASRIEKLADPGGICISQTVFDQIKNKIDIETLDLGQTELKNIKDNINLYKVILEAQDESERETPNEKEKEYSSNSDDKKKNESDVGEKIKQKIKDKIADSIPNIDIDIKDGDDEVKIDSSGIKVKDKDGTNVEIGFSGIKVKDKDGTNVEVGLSGINVQENVKDKVKSASEKIKGKRKTRKKLPNSGKAIIQFISGIALLVLIIGFFTEAYELWPNGVIYFLAVIISGKSIKTFFEYDFKKAILKLMLGVACLVLLIGFVADYYQYWYGIIGFFSIAIVISSYNTLTKS